MKVSMDFAYINDGRHDRGWRAVCHPEFDASHEARGIVHDFIDHGPQPNYATAEGELLAFGTILYSRCRFGSQGLTEAALASEIAGFLTGYWYAPDDCRIEDVPGTPNLLDDEDEALLRRISRAVMKSMLPEMEFMHWFDTGGPPSLAELVKCRRRIHAWLREGWWKAIFRFKDLSAPRLAELFEELSDKVRDAIRHVRDDDGIGATMVLTIDTEEAEATVSVTTAEDRYDELKEEEDEDHYH